MHELRTKAKELWHWETLRDCDRFQAVCSHNLDLLHHVYYGSPFESFRARLINDFGGTIQIESKYVWNISNDKEAPQLDLLNGSWSGSRRTLKVGQSLHKLMIELTSDFYRPLRVAVAHHRLHPDEFYHPISSPPRIYEAVRHLRQWLRQQKVPLQIIEKSGFYSLSTSGPVAVLVQNQSLLGSKVKTTAGKLKVHYGHNSFAISEVADHLDMPLRSTLRLLDKMLSENTGIERSGKGPATRYRFRAQA